MENNHVPVGPNCYDVLHASWKLVRKVIKIRCGVSEWWIELNWICVIFCRCECEKGYTGKNCSSPYVPCSPNPCENGGYCSSIGDYGYRCSCPPGKNQLYFLRFAKAGTLCQNPMLPSCLLVPSGWHFVWMGQQGGISRKQTSLITKSKCIALLFLWNGGNISKWIWPNSLNRIA